MNLHTCKKNKGYANGNFGECRACEWEGNEEKHLGLPLEAWLGFGFFGLAMGAVYVVSDLALKVF